MILGAGACVLFIGGTFRVHRHWWGGVALTALIVAGWGRIFNPLPHFGAASTADAVRYASPVVLGRLALLLRAVSIIGGIILVLVCWEATPENRAADYHACLLLMV